MTESWVDDLIARSLAKKYDSPEVKARAWTLFCARVVDWCQRDVIPTDGMMRAAWLDCLEAAREGK